MDVITKITRARIQLLFKHPFLGALALGMPVTDGSSYGCRTMAVDGKRLYYYAPFIETITDTELMGVIAHEIMHVVYQHVLDWRMWNGKDPDCWTMAQEYVVNDAVVNMFSLPLPGKPYLDPKYSGWYTEKVYADLVKNRPPKRKQKPSMGNGGGAPTPGDGHGSPQNGAGDQEAPGGGLSKEVAEKMLDQHGIGELPKSQEEADKMAQGMKLKIAQAANAARKAGKLPGGIERLVAEILEPKLPWRQVLAEFCMAMAKDDYSWKFPNRRHLARKIVLPSLHSESIELVIAIDTSGSISLEELTEFWSEIRAVMSAYPSYKIHLIVCDARVHHYQVIEPWDEVDPKGLMKGGGGTDFRPVFAKVEEENITPNALVFFTDTYGAFPKEEPGYPVLWIVKGTGDVPWGRKCELG